MGSCRVITRYARAMRGSVTVHMAAPADRVWNLVSDVTRIGEFSPETFEAEWLDAAAGPAVGARFRGHVRRNARGPVYWTVCTVTACDPGRQRHAGHAGEDQGGRRVGLTCRSWLVAHHSAAGSASQSCQAMSRPR
jgi:hypothetical protein